MATFIVPDPVPSATEDAERLRKACQGLFTAMAPFFFFHRFRNSMFHPLLHRPNVDAVEQLAPVVNSSDFTAAPKIRLVCREKEKNRLTDSQPPMHTGWGTDEKAIISVLAHRTAAQRSLIRQLYQQLYGEELIKLVQSELSGHFEKAVSQWILEPYDREAVMANVAIVQKQIDFRVIVEIAASRSSEELLKIKQAYLARYNRALEEDLLVGLVSSYRYEGPEVDLNLAKSEAKMLKDAIEGKAWSHEDLIRIFTTRSKAQLKATVNKYNDEYDKFLTKDLKENPDDKFLSALRAVIKSIYDPHKYFAKVLRQAIHQKGTDEDALTRVIVTRAEFDLKVIQEEFFKRNSVTLDEAIAKVTSGDYKDFILALLGTGKY
ncbi:Annexin D8 [Nymphaea thermarum]|nr:Annexin D8 [Nymphaea thermarum]